MKTMISMIVGLALATAASAAPPPGAQVMGPAWVGQRMDVAGRVIAIDDRCAEVNVWRNGLPGAGRVWVCTRHDAPNLLSWVHVKGTVTGTRMTRIGPRWWPAPVVNGSPRGR